MEDAAGEEMHDGNFLQEILHRRALTTNENYDIQASNIIRPTVSTTVAPPKSTDVTQKNLK